MVFTGDWIPDNELARMAGLSLDAGSRSPLVDASLRTSQPGIFAIGNLIHPVETADAAALDGVQVVQPVRDYLLGKRPAKRGYTIKATAPLRWIVPGRIDEGDPRPARNRLVAWCDSLIRFPTVVASQDGRELHRMRLAWPAAPGRAFRIPADILRSAKPGAGEVTISLC